MESPIVIDVWTVEPEQQEELVGAISANIERLAVNRPGFVSADIFASANGDLVVLNLRMRSVRDRQALTDSAELEAAYRDLRRIARSHSHIFRLAESFHATPAQPEDEPDAGR